MSTDAASVVGALLTDAQFAELKSAILARTPKEVMTRDEAAEYLGMSAQNLDLLRANGGGPKHVQIGRLIRYRKSVLDDWCTENTFDHAAAAAVAKGGSKQ